MPASTPSFGIAKVALVMARLIVAGEDRGPRFFIVPVCNEREMFRGVESIRLGPRPGTAPLDFSITSFDHVLVPHAALVASDLQDYSLPKFPLKAWWKEVWRIPIGTMTIVAFTIPALKAIAFISGKYSMHRSLTGKGPKPIRIISFRTQQWPILHAVAVSLVLENWYAVTTRRVTDTSLNPHVRHGLAVIVKTTVARHVQRCVSEVAERCGAQGDFEHNFMARFEVGHIFFCFSFSLIRCTVPQNDLKGVVVAEGDVRTLCIRLFSELLLERYQMPLPDTSDSLLAKHALSLFEENKALLQKLPRGHRDPAFNTLILPQAEHAIEAMGHAMAYSAAVRGGLPKPILDVYECAVVRCDPAWYVEQGGLTRFKQRVCEDDAVTRAMPHLATYLDHLDIEAYVSAPIVSDAAWKAYLGAMSVFRGSAQPSLGQLEDFVRPSTRVKAKL